jgi:hypothetical protein
MNRIRGNYPKQQKEQLPNKTKGAAVRKQNFITGHKITIT